MDYTLLGRLGTPRGKNPVNDPSGEALFCRPELVCHIARTYRGRHFGQKNNRECSAAKSLAYTREPRPSAMGRAGPREPPVFLIAPLRLLNILGLPRDVSSGCFLLKGTLSPGTTLGAFFFSS